MAGQRADVAVRSDAFAHAADLARLDRLAANVGVAAQQRGDLALALLGLQRARAIDDRASRPGERNRAVEQVGLAPEGASASFAAAPPWGELAMTPREAYLGAQEVVPAREAAGRIAAERTAAIPRW